MADKLTEKQCRWLNGKMAEAMGWHLEVHEGFIATVEWWLDADGKLQLAEGEFDPTHNFDQATMVAEKCCSGWEMSCRYFWAVPYNASVQAKGISATGGFPIGSGSGDTPAAALCKAIANMKRWEVPE